MWWPRRERATCSVAGGRRKVVLGEWGNCVPFLWVVFFVLLRSNAALRCSPWQLLTRLPGRQWATNVRSTVMAPLQCEATISGCENRAKSYGKNLLYPFLFRGGSSVCSSAVASFASLPQEWVMPTSTFTQPSSYGNSIVARLVSHQFPRKLEALPECNFNSWFLLTRFSLYIFSPT